MTPAEEKIVALVAELNLSAEELTSTINYLTTKLYETVKPTEEEIETVSDLMNDCGGDAIAALLDRDSTIGKLFLASDARSSRVDPQNACPKCKENHTDQLLINDETGDLVEVTCLSCDHKYTIGN